MKQILTNSYFVLILVVISCLFSLCLSLYLDDVEYFQASGAIVTVGGVLLASRKVIRLGFEEFLRNESTIDGGNLEPTMVEIENNRQFELDVKAYSLSVWLLIVGTIIWAYGGIFLRYCL